jgi:DNA-binding transcriptional regulator of glucitol operon
MKYNRLTRLLVALAVMAFCASCFMAGSLWKQHHAQEQQQAIEASLAK